jgi:hypothetical protein
MQSGADLARDHRTRLLATMTDPIRQMIARWRESAEWELEHGSPEFGKGRDQCADELEAALAAGPRPQAAPSAGDLLIRAVDAWAQHVALCPLEECGQCNAGFNQVRLAHKVWVNSEHKAAMPPAPPDDPRRI